MSWQGLGLGHPRQALWLDTEAEIQLFSHFAVCPWGSRCPSLGLSFPNYKLEIREVFTAQRAREFS